MIYDDLEQIPLENDEQSLTLSEVTVDKVGAGTAAEAVEFWTTRHGVVMASDADDTVARSLRTYREWAAEELDTLGAVVDVGNVVLEFGAEYGAHTMWLADLVSRTGRVIAVERDRQAFIALCTTLGLNRIANVHPLHAMLGKENDSLKLAGESVRAVSLDDLDLPSLHLIKLNLPGSLLDVVAGGRETLRRHRPAVYFRLSDMEAAATEIAALKDAGYRCWSHLPYLHNPANFAGTRANVFPGWVHRNVIAVHRTMPAEFEHLPEL